MENKDILFNHPHRTSSRNASSISSVTCLLSSPRKLLAFLLAKQTAPLAVKNAIQGIFYPRALIANAQGEDKGRSMVEMLGVLAIVGVLSAGALKGYSEAMFKYKMNKTIDTFSQVLQRFFELEQKGWGKGVYIGVSGDGAQDFVKYGLLDECQEAGEDDLYCRLPQGEIAMDFADTGSFIYGEFYIHFTSSKECMAFTSAGWENAVPIEWMSKPKDGYSGGFIAIDSKVIYDSYGNRGDAVKQVKMSDIVEGCGACDENVNNCFYYLVVRHEI